jgi:putative oxidoreductase
VRDKQSVSSMNLAELATAWSPRMLALLRIVAALLFMEHGAQNLPGFPPSDRGSPELVSLLGVAGILELGGDFFVLIGLFTRPIAFLLSGEMAVALNGGAAAILIVHHPLSRRGRPRSV